MPAVRAALASALGNKLDFSVDPMTVVAQGAAIYASTLENKFAASPQAAAPVAGQTAAVTLNLNHERSSGTPMSPVAGTLSGSGRASIHEIRIDADGGFWSSGWIPVASDRFAAQVMLAPGKPATHYVISARTKSGAAVAVTPNEFSIAFMLAMGSIPLPHTMAVELASSDGADRFDPVFKRHTPLPAEVRKTYRAERTLRPSDLNDTLPIKFWEIDVSEDPSEKWWAGCIKIRADLLRRPLMEGADIEITFKIDTSRKMTVDGFIPSINQAFSDEVYIPDPPSTRNQLQTQLDVCFERVHRLFKLLYGANRDELAPQVQEIQVELEEIAEHVARESDRDNRDPDALLAPTDRLRKLRVRINSLEEQLESERLASPLVVTIRAELRYTQNVVEEYGKETDHEACAALAAQFDRYVQANDHRGLRYVQEHLLELRASILVTQRAHFEKWRAYFSETRTPFLNQEQAKKYIEAANEASRRDDFPALREAINQLHALTPRSQLEAAEDQAKRSGLKET
jgi:molecular chaperone DnaK